MSLSKENKVIIDGQTYYGGLNQPNLKFIKVNVDCWEKIFDFLSLNDIASMSQTCQRMLQIGGHYFRENFHGEECGLSKTNTPTINGHPMERADFLRFIDSLFIAHSLEHLRTVSSMDLMNSLTTLRLWSIKLNEHQLHGFENIQSKIVNIDLDGCSIEDNSVGEFLASCSKLGSLQFRYSFFKSTAIKQSFFEHTYPMLEYFKYIHQNQEIELIPFLERNPNIKCLEIAADDFLKIPLDTKTVQLDYLNITHASRTVANEMLIRLKTLHPNGFFKKLRLSVFLTSEILDQFSREIISFIPLDTMLAYASNANINMCNLPQLTELYLAVMNENINLEAVAANLINLERLRIRGTVDHLLPFLRHSKKLKLVICENDVNKAFNAHNLNREREKSGVKRKVQIGLNECDYLATKWKANSLDNDLFEIVRIDKIFKYFYFEQN